jgi:hypothetical protein
MLGGNYLFVFLKKISNFEKNGGGAPQYFGSFLPYFIFEGVVLGYLCV